MYVKFILLFCLSISAAQPPLGCRDAIDLAFLVDNSASIREDNPYNGSYDNWRLVKEFVSLVVSKFRVSSNQTHVGLVRFSSDCVFEFGLTEYFDTGLVQQRVLALPYSGRNTNTADGLRVMYQSMFPAARTNAEKVLVILSDGLSNVNVDRTESEADELKRRSVTVFTVALSQQHDAVALSRMASAPSWKHNLVAGSTRSLHLLVPQLVYRICKMEPPPLCPSGEYFDGEQCRDCLLQVDLAILMDDSGSIRDKNPKDKSYDNFEILKNFIRNLVSRLPVGIDETHVAVIRYSTSSRIEMFLNDHYNSNDIQEVINVMTYTGGHTKTHLAIKHMRERVFQPSRGDRASAKNVAILITDGESTNNSLTLQQAELAKAEGVRFFTVGITNHINETELRLVASSPVADHYYNSTDFQQLNSLLTKLIKHVCRSHHIAATKTRSKRSADAQIVYQADPSEIDGSDVIEEGTDILTQKMSTYLVPIIASVSVVMLAILGRRRKMRNLQSN